MLIRCTDTQKKGDYGVEHHFQQYFSYIVAAQKKQEAQRCQKGIICFFIFCSENTESTRTNFGTNVHLMIP
jgi:hypothetical protein